MGYTKVKQDVSLVKVNGEFDNRFTVFGIIIFP
jgi:hypothetical protein